MPTALTLPMPRHQSKKEFASAIDAFKEGKNERMVKQL